MPGYPLHDSKSQLSEPGINAANKDYFSNPGTNSKMIVHWFSEAGWARFSDFLQFRIFEAQGCQHYKAKWREAEADLRDLCQSNSAQAQSFASKLQETNLEHQQLHTAQERQLQLEAQTLRQTQIEEQQAAALAREHELAIQEFRRQAEEQPELLKLQWRRQLSQSSYKAEIHELYTEMLNIHEKSKMQFHLSAQMCKLETPSRSVESEPENVLNT